MNTENINITLISHYKSWIELSIRIVNIPNLELEYKCKEKIAQLSLCFNNCL